eukprot:2795215-Prymnesium_polylepis.1
MLFAPRVGEATRAQKVGHRPLVLAVLHVVPQPKELLNHLRVQERVARLDAVHAAGSLVQHQERPVGTEIEGAVPRVHIGARGGEEARRCQILGEDTAEARVPEEPFAVLCVISDDLIRTDTGEPKRGYQHGYQHQAYTRAEIAQPEGTPTGPTFQSLCSRSLGNCIAWAVHEGRNTAAADARFDSRVVRTEPALRPRVIEDDANAHAAAVVVANHRAVAQQMTNGLGIP